MAMTDPMNSWRTMRCWCGQGAAVMSFETLGSHGDIHGEHHRKTIGKMVIQ